MKESLKRQITFITLLLFALIVKAQDADERGPHHVGISGLLTSDFTWQIDCSYHYMLCPYVGVGGSLCVWKQYSDEGSPAGDFWRTDDDSKELADLYLRPSLVLLSPTIIKIKDNKFGIYAEPGIHMKIPYDRVNLLQYENYPEYGSSYRSTHVSSKRGQWCALDLKLGIYLHTGLGEISAGYYFSTMDIYSYRRHMNYNGVNFSQFYPKSKNIGGAFLNIAAFL